jgi:hypothetical protein
MTEINQQRYKDILILLAPGLVSTRYMGKIVKLIGKDQKDVTIQDLKHVPFCLDMFFYAAVENGNKGRYTMAYMCVNAFHASESNYNKYIFDEWYQKHEITHGLNALVFSGTIFDDWDEIRYFPASIWPNWDEAHQ